MCWMEFVNCARYCGVFNSFTIGLSQVRLCRRWFGYSKQGLLLDENISSERNRNKLVSMVESSLAILFSPRELRFHFFYSTLNSRWRHPADRKRIEKAIGVACPEVWMIIFAITGLAWFRSMLRQHIVNCFKEIYRVACLLGVNVYETLLVSVTCECYKTHGKSWMVSFYFLFLPYMRFTSSPRNVCVCWSIPSHRWT